MKEKLYTIPLMDAFSANDECPLCFIEQKLLNDALDFTLGASSSYMESDIREQTDNMGFCREHLRKMYIYGNTLGNALILKTHLAKLNTELKEQLSLFKPVKQSVFSKLKGGGSDSGLNQIGDWAAKKEKSCFICDYINNTYDRYIDTFFFLFKSNPEFIEMIRASKGFCLHHFGDLTRTAALKLNSEQQKQYSEAVFPVMSENMNRMYEDMSWLVEKFDYRNADADWKNSKDALQRGIQKITGGYPDAPDYKSKR